MGDTPPLAGVAGFGSFAANFGESFGVSFGEPLDVDKEGGCATPFLAAVSTMRLVSGET